MYEYQKTCIFNHKRAFFIHFFWVIRRNHVLLPIKKLTYYEIYQLERKWTESLRVERIQ